MGNNYRERHGDRRNHKSRPDGGGRPGHPVKGFYNYIVGQLAANPNVLVIEEDATQEQIDKQVETLLLTAKTLCDKVHARNKERFEDEQD